MGPESPNGYLIRDRERRHGEAKVMSGGRGQSDASTPANKHHGPLAIPGNEGEVWNGGSLTAPGKDQPCDTLILDSGLTRCKRINFCCFKTPSLWYFVKFFTALGN